MSKRPVYVKPEKRVAHLAQLMLLFTDPDNRDTCKCTRVMRPCISGKCYGRGVSEPPYTEHMKARAPSTLAYVCLKCGQQMILSDLPDLDEIEELPFELQRLAVLDHAEYKRRMKAKEAKKK